MNRDSVDEETKVPVLFLVFNRPDLTAKVFAEIRNARPSKLFIAADGPRAGRASEAEACAFTRKMTENVDWECEVHRLYRDKNLGCKQAVSSAISWFFEHVESGIILEDDCLPAPAFFDYASELLSRYSTHPSVGVISGFNPHPQTWESSSSYHFSQHPLIWGWATWRRVWQNYDPDLSNWSGKESDLSDVFNNRFLRQHFAHAFSEASSGVLDTWDVQLLHLCATTKLFTAIPSVNLIENIGFDARASHTKEYSGRLPLPRRSNLSFPLIHPDTVQVNHAFDRMVERMTWRVPNNSIDAAAIWIISKFRFLGGRLLRVLHLRPPPLIKQLD